VFVPTRSLFIEDAGLNEGNLDEDVYELEGALMTHMRNLSCPIWERAYVAHEEKNYKMMIDRVVVSTSSPRQPLRR